MLLEDEEEEEEEEELDDRLECLNRSSQGLLDCGGVWNGSCSLATL
jgi:hypothetical protein